jgi:hypothetical protein
MSEEKSLEKPEPSRELSTENLPVEIENLPPEMRTMVSVMAGFFRSTSGPDPETARILAQTEMHEETCKLQGFTESLKIKDQQNERDHKFRTQRLNHESAKTIALLVVCIVGIICGLYLIVEKQNTQVGTPLLVASFMAMLAGKGILPKDKD